MNRPKPASNKPMKPSAVEVSKVVNDKMKTKKYQNGQEARNAKMWYSDKKLEFRIQTPLAKVPFGLTIGTKDEKKEGKKEKYMKGRGPKWSIVSGEKYSFDFNVDGTPELEEFKKLVQEMDEKNIKYIHSQSEEWWKKKMSEESIRDMGYGSMIKEDKEGEYPDRFKLKLPFYEGKPLFKLYDENNKKIDWVSHEEGKDPVLDWSWAQRGMHIEAIMECEGLWEVNKKVYCTWKALQIRFIPTEDLDECAFDDSGNGPAAAEDDEVDSAVASKTKAKPKAKDEDDTKVEDDDAEEEDEEEEEAEEEAE